MLICKQQKYKSMLKVINISKNSNHTIKSFLFPLNKYLMKRIEFKKKIKLAYKI